MVNSDFWQPVIGLEIHVQLKTKSKLFSPARNHFGDAPNTNISDVCTGQPGTLPVLNQEAVKKAVQFGCAIGAHISPLSTFDRKSYFYPDSPRNYQITQFEHPLLLGGKINVHIDGLIKQFTLLRSHLEEDAGMIKHFETFGAIDYNRAGVPLLEIVSAPCIHSAQEASALVSAIELLMVYLDASNCNMEEGSLRIDANVSVRLGSEKELRPQTEIKNMNSLSHLECAIETEIKRQIELYTLNPHEKIIPATYRFDPKSKTNILMRLKESVEDYRYFQEPDLLPLLISPDYVEKIQKSLPELPSERLHRYTQILKIPEKTASTLIHNKPLSDYFEKALPSSKNPSLLANWILVEFGGRMQKGETLPESGILAQNISSLVNKIEEKKLTGKLAKQVADFMVESPHLSPDEVIHKNPELKPLDDLGLLEILIDAVLLENPTSIDDFKSGKAKAFIFLVGKVMERSKGCALPHLVHTILLKKLS